MYLKARDQKLAILFSRYPAYSRQAYWEVVSVRHPLQPLSPYHGVMWPCRSNSAANFSPQTLQEET